MPVRVAAVSDIPAVMTLCELFHAESSYAPFPVDREWGEALARRFHDDRKNALFLVAERDGDIYGFFVATLQPVAFNPTLAATQQLLFIRKDKRRGLAAAQFIRRYLAWASERRTLFVDFAVTVGIDDQGAGRLAEKFGFKPVGIVYRRMTPAQA